MDAARNSANSECRRPFFGASGGEGFLKRWGTGGVTYGPLVAILFCDRLPIGVGGVNVLLSLCDWVRGSIVSPQARILRPQQIRGERLVTNHPNQSTINRRTTEGGSAETDGKEREERENKRS